VGKGGEVEEGTVFCFGKITFDCVSILLKATWNSLFRKHDLSGDQGVRFGILIITIYINAIRQQLK
jgi:hypothetical protein